MAYKVQRREFVRYQPKWLFRFLISLSPKVYEVKDSLEEARANIQQIKDALEENTLSGSISRLRITYDDTTILISSQKNRPYLKFYIQDNYKKI
jgi:hypothetical protein